MPWRISFGMRLVHHARSTDSRSKIPSSENNTLPKNQRIRVSLSREDLFMLSQYNGVTSHCNLSDNLASRESSRAAVCSSKPCHVICHHFALTVGCFGPGKTRFLLTLHLLPRLLGRSHRRPVSDRPRRHGWIGFNNQQNQMVRGEQALVTNPEMEPGLAFVKQREATIQWISRKGG